MKYLPLFGTILSTIVLITNIWFDFKLYMPSVVAKIILTFFWITFISLMFHSLFLEYSKKEVD